MLFIEMFQVHVVTAEKPNQKPYVKPKTIKTHNSHIYEVLYCRLGKNTETFQKIILFVFSVIQYQKNRNLDQ